MTSMIRPVVKEDDSVSSEPARRPYSGQTKPDQPKDKDNDNERNKNI